MISFFIKKAFFDGWDNLFSLAALNAVHLILAFVSIVLPMSMGADGLTAFACITVGIFLLSLWQSICAFAMCEVANYRSLGIKATLAFFPKALKPGLLTGLFSVLIWFAVSVGIPFYIIQKGIVGVFLAGMLFWTCLVGLLVWQYYLPLEARLGGGFKKNIRKAFILFLDNPGFSLFLFGYSILTIAVSALPAFLAPGLAGLALAQADAVKLRMLKYEWLESTPNADKHAVPWNELLAEEKEMVGVRTLKGMIFPWKEGK